MKKRKASSKAPAGPIKGMARNRLPGGIITSMLIRVIGFWAVLNGSLICLGGASRWGSPAYNVVEQVPGAPETWGVVIILAGLCTLVGSYTKKYWLKNIGLMGTATYCLFFSIGFSYAAFLFETMSFGVGTLELMTATLSLILCYADEDAR